MVVAGDAVGTMDSKKFLAKADSYMSDPNNRTLPSPVVPHGYNRIAEYQMEKYGVTREQLAMVSVLMSRQAIRHPLAVTKVPHSLEKVLSATPIASSTTLLECARKADGGGAIIVASDEFIQNHNLGATKAQAPAVVGVGEASGPLYPPEIIDESMFSCGEASAKAYKSANLEPTDINFFGLYDCYPICFLRAVEAVGLAKEGEGGKWIEKKYL